MIQFLLNDKLIKIKDLPADITLLEFLRENKSLTGTKEGCASGDCGACTVVIGQVKIGNTALGKGTEYIEYKAINSCITFLSALHEKRVITVEHLSKGIELHPVQRAMVNSNATQCGFCTPGFVMSIYALYQNASIQQQKVDRDRVIKALSGNLCRCTGYQPIIEASLEVCESSQLIRQVDEEINAIRALKAIRPETALTKHSLLPTNRNMLRQCILDFPEAKLVAGSTDLALVRTQQLQALPELISLKYVSELNRIEKVNDTLIIGSTCTLTDIEEVVLEHFPELKELFERFASVPIRNQATLGGNIANASPIGDLAPVLIALNATVMLDNGESVRKVALKEFFVGYKQTVMISNEWIDSIEIPLLNKNQALKAYKVSKRIEDDISAVLFAVCIELHDGKVKTLKAGFGGVAPVPSECFALERALKNKNWKDPANVKIGQNCLFEAFEPISDVRASASYRQTILKNLWYRFWLETNDEHLSIQTRVTDHA